MSSDFVVDVFVCFLCRGFVVFCVSFVCLFVCFFCFVFLLGNSNLHHITSQGYYDLKIDMEDFEGNTRFALYKNLSVSSEDDSFRLSIGEYSGDAGIVKTLHTMVFSPSIKTWVCENLRHK